MDDCGCGAEGTEGWRDGQKREEGDRKKGVSGGQEEPSHLRKAIHVPAAPGVSGPGGAPGVSRAMATALGSLSGRSAGRRAGGRGESI